MRIVIAVLAALFLAPAWADIYKCTEAGKTIYQQAPCAKGFEFRSGTNAVEPSPVERRRAQIQGLRDRDRAIRLEAEHDNERLELEREQIQAGQRRRAAAVQQRECQRRERDTAWVESTSEKYARRDHERLGGRLSTNSEWWRNQATNARERQQDYCP